MKAITNQFIVPIAPQPPPPIRPVYPWENTNLYNICVQLYELAERTGYEYSFEEFKSNFGAYLESKDTIINVDEYTGQYIVTPLPELEQILRTDNKILKHDITVEPIPYYETSNDAGGYTVIIG